MVLVCLKLHWALTDQGALLVRISYDVNTALQCRIAYVWATEEETEAHGAPVISQSSWQRDSATFQTQDSE